MHKKIRGIFTSCLPTVCSLKQSLIGWLKKGWRGREGWFEGKEDKEKVENQERTRKKIRDGGEKGVNREKMRKSVKIVPILCTMSGQGCTIPED